MNRRLLAALVAVGAVLASISPLSPAPSGRADAAPAFQSVGGSLVNGAGSTYVALAMQQWVTDGTARGLRVNYTPTGSPDGLQRYSGSQINFGGTEAEFRSFGTSSIPRGYQYVPDVAGAIAMMYNLRDRAGNKVDYLHLSQRTIARIFMGDITTWADPQISSENAAFKFPDKAINVVFRSGQSGTTALFYDFVKNAAPDVFGRWAAKYQVPADVRILEPPVNFAPKTQGLGGSDQIAQFIGGDSGAWSIGYDEFGYARTYGVPSAWVQNRSNKWVLPYAENISAALESATLRPDLSQELSGVYASGNAKAYPISAYSYIVTQCVASKDRPSCAGPYSDKGVTDTLAPWMRYIACDGQVNMARIGYSPLPPNLSQEIANSVGRLQGRGAEQLNSSNCANPRFRGSLGAGASSPADPFEKLPGGVAGNALGGNQGSGSGAGPATGNQPGNGGQANAGGAGGGPRGPGAAGPGAAGPGAARPGTAGPGAAGPGAAGPGAVGPGVANGNNGRTAGPGAASGASGPGAAAGTTPGAANNDASATTAQSAGPGRKGAEQAVGGGSGTFRAAEPTSYRRGDAGGVAAGVALALVVALLLPPIGVGLARRRTARRNSA